MTDFYAGVVRLFDTTRYHFLTKQEVHTRCLKVGVQTRMGLGNVFYLLVF